MSHQISLKQLRESIMRFRNGDISNYEMNTLLNRYFLDHAPLFTAALGELKVNPGMSLYIAWKDSKPSFHFCYKRDIQSAEMMMSNEYTEYGDMSHRSVEDWLQILEAGNVISQVTAENAVEDTIVKQLVNSPKRSLTLNEQEHKTTWSDARNSVTLDHYTGSISISYGGCETTVLIQEYNQKKFLENLAIMMLIKHLGRLIRNRLTD